MDPNEQKLIAYYNKFPEDKRLDSRHGQVEYRLTRHFVDRAMTDAGAGEGPLRILDVGAGTGRYAGPLSAEGHEVIAVDLVRYHLGIMRKKWPGLDVRQGDARDLSGAGLGKASRGSFDLILLLGPMYHLTRDGDKARALAEAARLLAPRGRLLVAYLMNEYSVLTYGFKQRHILEMLPDKAGQEAPERTEEGRQEEAWDQVGSFGRDHRSSGSLDASFAVCPSPTDLYDYVRPEDIAGFDREANRISRENWLKEEEGLRKRKGPPQLVRDRIFSPDGPAGYMRRELKALSEEEFDCFVAYQLSVCQRQDLLGAGGHLVEVLRLSEKSVE